MVWRPQLLLLSHDPAAATTVWPDGSSNSSRRPQQHGCEGAFAIALRDPAATATTPGGHGLAEPYRCCYGAMLLLPPGEVATAGRRSC